MSSTSDKASGLINEAIGKLKQSVGSAVGSDDLKVKGNIQERKGDAEQAIGNAKSAASGGDSNFAATDRESKIRTRAYHLWQAEGFPDGREHDHWRQAEREIETEDSEQSL